MSKAGQIEYDIKAQRAGGGGLDAMIQLGRESVKANEAVGQSCAALGVEIVTSKGKPLR